MPTTTRRLATLAIAAPAAFGIALGVAAPANATTAVRHRTPVYVALGDSFAAGAGAGGARNACYQSLRGWGVSVARAEHYKLTYAACYGATEPDIVTKQLPRTPRNADVVTVMDGGNDAGFINAVASCSLLPTTQPCAKTLATAKTVIDKTLPGRLDTLLKAIHAHDPHAKVYLVGYPDLFPTHPTRSMGAMTPARQLIINQRDNEIAKVQIAAAHRNHATYVDLRPAFRGHEITTAHPYLNGLKLDVVDSVHPNAAGNNAMAAVVEKAMKGRK